MNLEHLFRYFSAAPSPVALHEELISLLTHSQIAPVAACIVSAAGSHFLSADAGVLPRTSANRIFGEPCLLVESRVRYLMSILRFPRAQSFAALASTFGEFERGAILKMPRRCRLTDRLTEGGIQLKCLRRRPSSAIPGSNSSGCGRRRPRRDAVMQQASHR